jgi:hypothetical protein
MSLKTKTFVCCGGLYRTKEFPAVAGLELLYKGEDAAPDEVLIHTEVNIDGEWYALNNRDAINDFVKDLIGVLPPLFVLKELVSAVKDENFGFLADWRGVKVPNRFLSEAKTVRSEYSAPIISNLIQAEKATLRELEEYYSVHDAFKMFDIVLVNTVNKAFAQEQADREAKRRK